MKTLRRWGSFAVLLIGGFAVTTGCWSSGWAASDDDAEPGSAGLVIERAHQSGAMGDVLAYSGATFMHEVFAYEGFTHVRLDSQGEGWWVMTAIEINGPDLRSLEPGRVYTSSALVASEDQPEVNVVGCSGPEYPRYTYDTSAERTELQVQDLGGGVRRVSFRAWFRADGDAGEQLAEGSFDIRPQD